MNIIQDKKSKIQIQMYTDKLKILAIYSRLLVFIIQYISNVITPDHAADAFLYPNTSDNYTIIDKAILHLLGGFVRWDAQYFMHIAKYGYTYENTLAFFPLYPLFARLISSIVYFIVPFTSLDSILVLVFVALNSIIFVLAVKQLFDLTTIIFNETIAYKATILFCFNPASVFFMAPYTECMFSYLTFRSIYNCLVLYKKFTNPDYKVQCFDVMYLIPISLSTSVRSNGVLNIGFLAYTCLCIFCKYHSNDSFSLKVKFLVKYFFIMSSLSVICLIPFVIYQIFCYQWFCTNFKIQLPDIVTSEADINEFILPGQFSKYNQSWCYDKIPLAYTYVQNHYWNVGFLKYYTVKQIPNFLLAAPTLYIVVRYCCQHIKHNINNRSTNIFTLDKVFKKEKSIDIFFGPHLNVFVIHALFLSIFCALFIHIQVATRMICSATPLFYWASASYLRNVQLDNVEDVISCKKSLGGYVKIYFLTYFVIGTVMFSNFLPWT